MPSSSHKKQQPDTVLGYYRYPTLYKNTIVFTAEGDLWRVSRKGGLAQRLTTHHGCESHATISPDGRTLAFSAEYEGPTEVYTMPLQGGLPIRRTYEGETALAVGWTPDGKILYSTQHYSTLPNRQLATLDPQTQAHYLLPLHQASDGVFTPDGSTLFFTRLPFQGSHTKRYQGGTAQNIWKFTLPKADPATQAEAIPLTCDYPGTSKTPMWWNSRIYFASDRDGTMNIWSMDENGQELCQHTFHKGWDIQSPALHQGRIVYQAGADLWLFEIATSANQLIPITLVSDFEQARERWIKNPLEYLSALHLAPTGESIVLTARGRVFVAPTKQGRMVEVTRKQGVRYRDARFMPDGKSLLMLSDESGELEFWQAPANGVGENKRLSQDGRVFRYEGIPSPDGQWIAYDDKDLQLWLLHIANQTETRIAVSDQDHFGDLAWSPDSRWLAYVADADNGYPQIQLYHVERQLTIVATSDRVDSYNPVWSPDGKWLYFLSDRHFNSLVSSPWGPRQPEPYFDKTTKIYMLALSEELRSPFQPLDEVFLAQQQTLKKDSTSSHESTNQNESPQTDQPAEVGAAEGINKAQELGIYNALNGLATRLLEVPVMPNNYANLTMNNKYLFWTESEPGVDGSMRLVALEIKNLNIAPVVLLQGIRSYELASDGKKLIVQKNGTIYLIDAVAEAPKELEKCRVDLNRWTFAVNPREEWRQMLLEAWRMARDFFYDPSLHGVDWRGSLEKHLPLVQRVTDRDELNDLIAQLVSELSALHMGIAPGEPRRGQPQIILASLGATLVRDPATNGYVINQIYQTDPDYPEQRGPLAKQDIHLTEGDVIEAINGVSTLAVDHPAILLKNQAEQQVLLRVRSVATNQASDLIVRPISPWRAFRLRYTAWEYQTRQFVDQRGAGQIGYVHLRGMTGENYAEWARDYYPVFNRHGLIIDVRNNHGGNIDSWILEKLLRRAWFYRQPRIGKPDWNMQYAFRGHLVVLCNEHTSSNGEIFAEGIRQLGLGKIIGTRTWGGAIWRTYILRLVDRGNGPGSHRGMYSPEGEWMIEGHGVEPDIVVDNLPHATFLGHDAQLEAAIQYLQEQIRQKPIVTPPAPPYPNKSFRYDE